MIPDSLGVSHPFDFLKQGHNRQKRRQVIWWERRLIWPPERVEICSSSGMHLPSTNNRRPYEFSFENKCRTIASPMPWRLPKYLTSWWTLIEILGKQGSYKALTGPATWQTMGQPRSNGSPCRSPPVQCGPILPVSCSINSFNSPCGSFSNSKLTALWKNGLRR